MMTDSMETENGYDWSQSPASYEFETVQRQGTPSEIAEGIQKQFPDVDFGEILWFCEDQTIDLAIQKREHFANVQYLLKRIRVIDAVILAKRGGVENVSP